MGDGRLTIADLKKKGLTIEDCRLTISDFLLLQSLILFSVGVRCFHLTSTPDGAGEVFEHKTHGSIFQASISRAIKMLY
jgi:hypothetical protein